MVASPRVMDQAFQDAAALGVTVCCAAGDDGSSDLRALEPDDGLLHTDFPASSPYALACGGTRLEGSGSTIPASPGWDACTALGSPDAAKLLSALSGHQAAV